MGRMRQRLASLVRELKVPRVLRVAEHHSIEALMVLKTSEFNEPKSAHVLMRDGTKLIRRTGDPEDGRDHVRVIMVPRLVIASRFIHSIWIHPSIDAGGVVKPENDALHTLG